MRIDVAFIPAEVANFSLAGKTAIVIDVLRATTTITTACANGCARVVPVLEPDDAQRLMHELESDWSLERTEILLGGERHARSIPGFDLGNSPLEYGSETVARKTIIMTTTNGTRAFAAVAGAERVCAAAFLNLSAVAEWCPREAGDLLIVCAGLRGKASLEDTACAGALIQRLASIASLQLGDGAFIAHQVHQVVGGNVEALFALSEHGRYLASLGAVEDLSYCARVDSVSVVPVGGCVGSLFELKPGRGR